MANVLRVAVIPGDGIGQEVMPVALRVLQSVAASESNLRLDLEEFEWSSRYYLDHGQMMPDNALDILRSHDAVFLGAMGAPDLVPDHISLWGSIIRIRRGLNQTVNVRPARYLAGLQSPLRDPRNFDLLVVRENSEGEYSQIGGTIHEGPQETAIQVSVFTRRSSERVIRYAFAAARKRRRHVVSATKSNGIVHTMPFWDRVFGDVARDFPDVKTESVHLDALLARLVRSPDSLDVIVGSNLFGDLLTDLTAALMGSIGIAPSANLNLDGDAPSMFEPVHGSAPDIAGKGIANPLGQVWTAALMVEHLGYQSAADRIVDAVSNVVRNGEVTPDLGGKLTTSEVGQALLQRLV